MRTGTIHPTALAISVTQFRRTTQPSIRGAARRGAARRDAIADTPGPVIESLRVASAVAENQRHKLMPLVPETANAIIPGSVTGRREPSRIRLERSKRDPLGTGVFERDDL